MARPFLHLNEIKAVCRDLYGIDVKNHETLLSFEDTNYLLTVSDSSSAELKTEVERLEQRGVWEQVLLKVSRDKNFNITSFEMQLEAMRCLLKDGFICSNVLSGVDGSYYFPYERTSDSGKTERYVIRILTFLPGSSLKYYLHVLDERVVIQEVGELVAKMHLSFQGIEVTRSRTLVPSDGDPWMLENLSLLKNYFHDYKDDKLKCLTRSVQDFTSNVIPAYPLLPKGLIHGDIHDMNIIVNFQSGHLLPVIRSTDTGAESSDVISKYGIIDFGDLSYSCVIFDVALIVRDFMVDVTTIDSSTVTGHFLTGYLKHKILTKEELWVLPECIMGALCQYGVLGEQELRKQPDNEYVGYGAESAWKQLQKFSNISKNDMISIWNIVLRENGCDVVIENYEG